MFKAIGQLWGICFASGVADSGIVGIALVALVIVAMLQLGTMHGGDEDAKNMKMRKSMLIEYK